MDDLMRETARRLRLLGYASVSRRLGDGSFALLAAGSASDEMIATKILGAFDAPFIPGGAILHLGAHVGIARGASSDDSASELVRQADAAARRASETAARWASAASTQGRKGAQADRLQTVAALQQAMTQGDLLLHFQPVVGVQDSDVRCLEALVRWQGPDGRLVPPAS